MLKAVPATHTCDLECQGLGGAQGYLTLAPTKTEPQTMILMQQDAASRRLAQRGICGLAATPMTALLVASAYYP